MIPYVQILWSPKNISILGCSPSRHCGTWIVNKDPLGGDWHPLEEFRIPTILHKASPHLPSVFVPCFCSYYVVSSPFLWFGTKILPSIYIYIYMYIVKEIVPSTPQFTGGGVQRRSRWCMAFDPRVGWGSYGVNDSNGWCPAAEENLFCQSWS